MAFSSEIKEVGLDYWLRWQVPVCALIIIIPSVISLNLIIKRSRREDGHNQLKSSDYGYHVGKIFTPSGYYYTEL